MENKSNQSRAKSQGQQLSAAIVLRITKGLIKENNIKNLKLIK